MNGTDPEHGGRIFLQKSVTSYHSKRHYIPQEFNLVITFKPRNYCTSTLRWNDLCVVLAILQNKPLLKHNSEIITKASHISSKTYFTTWCIFTLNHFYNCTKLMNASSRISSADFGMKLSAFWRTLLPWSSGCCRQSYTPPITMLTKVLRPPHSSPYTNVFHPYL